MPSSKKQKFIAAPLLAGLIFSGVTFQQPVGPAGTSKQQSQRQPPVSDPAAAIKVVYLAAAQQVAVQDGPVSKPVGCAFSETAAFPQSAVGADLFRRPAGCFSLSLGKVTAAAGLAVRPLRESILAVRVIVSGSAILPDNLNPAPAAGRSVPMLPAIAPFMAAAIFAGLGKIKHKSAVFYKKNPAIFSGFFRFEILRC